MYRGTIETEHKKRKAKHRFRIHVTGTIISESGEESPEHDFFINIGEEQAKKLLRKLKDCDL